MESGHRGFVVTEARVGKNGELSEAVGEQMEHNVRHIRDEAADAYARCTEKTYAQRSRLALDDGNGSIHLPPRHCHPCAEGRPSLRSGAA